MNLDPEPTEEQITEYAERLFPANLDAQMSFTLGVWRSILDIREKQDEKARIKAININTV